MRHFKQTNKGGVYAFAKAYTGIILITIFLLSVVKGTAQKSLTPIVPSHHSSNVYKIITSTDDQYAATLGSDGRVKLWAVKSKKILTDIALPAASDGFFTEDTKYLGIRIGTLLQLYSVPSLELVSSFANVEGSCASVEGSGFYYSEYKYDADTWRIYYQKSPKAIPKVIYEAPIGNKSNTEIVAFARWMSLSPDGEKLMFTHYSRQTYILDLTTQELTNPMEYGYAFLPNGEILSIARESTKEFEFFATNLKGKTQWKKKVTLNQVKSDLERLYAISAKEKTIYFPTESGLFTINYERGKERLYPEWGNVSTIGVTNKELWGSDGKQFGIATAPIKKPAEYTPIGFRNLVKPEKLTASGNALTFFAGSFTSKDPKIATITPGGIRTREISFPVDVVGATFGTKGDLFATSLQSEDALRLYDLEKEEFYDYTNAVDYNDHVALSEDGSILAHRGREQLAFYNVKTTQKILEVSKDVINDYNAQHPIAISPDNTWAVVMIRVKEEGTIYNHNHLAMFDLTTGKQLWIKKYDGISGVYAVSNNEFVTLSNFRLKVDFFNAKTGVLRVRNYISGAINSDINDVNVAKNLVATVQVNDNRIYVGDIHKSQLLHTFKGHESKILHVQFIGDNFLLSAGDANELILWDLTTGKRAGNVYLFERSKDWAFVTPQGHFDGSEKALKMMYYVNGNAILPLEQLYEGYYIPNLLASVIAHQEIGKTEIDLDNLKTAPSITIEYKEGTRNLIVEDDIQPEEIKTQKETARLILKATAPEDKIVEIRLYHNDKRLTDKTRNLTVEDDIKDGVVEKTFDVQLLPGKNIFKAVAVNSQKTESPPTLLEVTYDGAKELPVSRGIVLHSLIIGINEYKNGKYNLNYAKADATSFQEEIAKGMMGLTKSQNAIFIKDTDATKENITAALEKIASEAQPQDIFVFYYAGHGVMNNEKEFYIVPTDVTQLYGNDASLSQKGISASFLKDLATNITAQKQLYILDACQSAGALNAVASRGAAEEKAIAQLARSTGTHWLTASGSEQFATEFSELGHGVFTYALLEALSGKADSGDKRVTVNEIKAYIESRVPEISEKYKGSPQYPSSFGFGQDFPVSVSN